MIKRYLLIAFILLAVCKEAFAVEFYKSVLANGLTVIHIERKSLPAVMGNLLLRASPFDEPAQKAGLANLTATLLTEGTLNLSSLEFHEQLDYMGSSISASVSRDYTSVYFRTLKQNLPKTFELFTETIFKPAFKQSEFEKKQLLIKSMIKRQEEQPQFVASKKLLKAIFPESHPYSRQVTGDLQSIDNITLGDVKDFYSRYYSPDGAILVIAGDITKEEFLSLIKPFANWQSKPKPPVSLNTVNLPQTDKCITMHTHKDITQANISLGHVGIARSNPDFYAVSVMNYILGGGGFASRLMQTVRDEMGLAYSIYSFFYASLLPGYFEVSVQTSAEKAELAIAEILKTMQRLRTEPVSDDELRDAKSFLTGSFPRRLETTQRVLDMITAQEFYKLGDDYIKKYPEYINAVSKDDVLRVAQKYLHPDRCYISVVGKALSK